MEHEAFQQAKLAIKQAQALGIFDPTLPAELVVHVAQNGFGWDLWQPPLDSGFRSGMEQKKDTV